MNWSFSSFSPKIASPRNFDRCHSNTFHDRADGKFVEINHVKLFTGNMLTSFEQTKKKRITDVIIICFNFWLRAIIFPLVLPLPLEMFTRGIWFVMEFKPFNGIQSKFIFKMKNDINGKMWCIYWKIRIWIICKDTEYCSKKSIISIYFFSLSSSFCLTSKGFFK